MDTQHYFIFNPAAGARDARERLQRQLDRLSPVPYTLLITNGVGHAGELTRELCQQGSAPVRIYACGGDGTLGEVAGGARGHKHAAVGVWPCGSGNDYTRVYGGPERFLDLGRQLDAPSVLVDLILANGRAAINVVNLGLEAQAAATMLRFRHTPLLGGKRAYWMGVLNAFTSHLATSCAITADGQPLHEGQLLTASFASGQYIGGGFHCAPRSLNDDGLLDACAILPLSRLQLLRLLPLYKQGRHFESPLFEGLYRYRQARRVGITCEQETALCLDGEMMRGRDFELEVLPRAVRFILPPA